MGREILVDWNTPGGGALTVLNFSTAVAASVQRAAIAAFLGDVSGSLSSQVVWTVRTEGAEFDDATGLQTGFWNDPTVLTDPGSASAQPVADATQILFRWRTSVVVAGRRVQGRSFIPGYLASGLTGGNLSAASQTALNTIAQGFVDTEVGLGVYSRPTDSRPGTLAAVESGSVWAELAVQRRRRG